MAKIIQREWTSREMTKLGRAHFTQKLHATELDEISINRRERVTVCQRGVNGVAGADEICDFFFNISHGVVPYE